ncbi:MAG TPA: hypothetical protein VGM77_02405 [Gemmatimonadales bacterium]
MSRSALVALALCLVAGCHTDAFDAPPQDIGPISSGADVQLTFNPQQDYWPTWTEDGAGILYAYVDAAHVGQRCVGLLPAAGGTQQWNLCDTRFVHHDSSSSFAGYALGSDGRLLYTEAVSHTGSGNLSPVSTVLWLADSAAPFARTALLSLPFHLNDTAYSVLTDIAWTGPTTFVALAQDFSLNSELTPPCNFVEDTTFRTAGLVVTGTIVNGQAVMQAVPGTGGAAGYSLAEGGASVVFTLANDLRLLKVPLSGGAPVGVASIPGGSGALLLGVSCKGVLCVVATDPVTGPCVNYGGGSKQLVVASITTGVTQILLSQSAPLVVPKVSPVSADVVVQVGGSLGHLQTFLNPTDGNVHLLRHFLQ